MGNNYERKEKDMEQKEQFKIKKADIIFIFVIVAIAIIFMLAYTFLYQDEGVWVVVYQDGEEIERYSIEEEGFYTINESNTFEIRDGIVDMIDADCKNQICVNHIAIDSVGETIVCLPNKIVVAIEGEKEEETLDSIVN